MIEKICDICERLFFTWLIVVGGITVDVALLVLFIKLFKDTVIGGIILSIPIITFIIILSIFCYYLLIGTWKK